MDIELRGNAVHICGYVNAVDRDSRILPKEMAPDANGDFVERIQPGVFARALETGKPVGLMFNHARDLGGTAKGNLTLAEDAVGLKADARIEDAEVAEAARSGRLQGWSFGFRYATDKWETTKEAPGLRRILTSLVLEEVSILTETPAYIATSVEMRGEGEAVLEMRGFADTAPAVKDAELEAMRLYIELQDMAGGV